MSKYRGSYINTHKRIIVELLLSILLFTNCDRLAPTTNSVDYQPAQGEIQRETMTLDQQENTELVRQTQTGFSSLPIELQAYILSFLDQKNFHRASLVCHAWRAAAFMAEDEKTLDLSRKDLDKKDCQVLLQVPFTSLILRECQLKDQEMLILSQSTRIKHLNLESNRIRDAGAQALASGNLAALTSLVLGYNSIGAAGAQALASGNLAALTSLVLGYNSIGDAGAQALASGNLSALTSLVLGFNSIGAAGAHALASGNLSALTSLVLYNNSIGAAGAQALASGNLSALTSLDLRRNNIEAEGKKALRAWSKKKFIELDL